MASVTISKVWKLYGKTEAVRDLNLEGADGEFLCVLGPSGCGKSSTLRMLAGLEHISSGDIYFGETRVNDLPPKDRDIAMVFENYALYPHKTVFDNIANALRLRSVDDATIKEKVYKAAQILEIEHLLDRRPGELSGGQKQRTAIGRAIVREPQLFLFDEPIAHLDAKLRAHMRGELKLMQRDLGTTMVYVTHDQIEALSMADRVAVMHDGVLQQFGTPNEIYNSPVSEWVAGFIGEPPMNFLDCDLGERDGGFVLSNAHFTFDLGREESALIRAHNVSGPVRFGIRPDEIGITKTDPGGGAIQAKVLVTEPLGGDMLVDVALGEAKLLVKTKGFEADSSNGCYLDFGRGRHHIFDRSSGIAFTSGLII